MLTRVEALNFRCLRYVSRSLDPFHVLVGPNASGKTTFFDVVGFVSRLLNDGLESAMEAVSPDPLDLLFGRKGDHFELALEATIPESVYPQQPNYQRIRYELVVSVPSDNNPPTIAAEKVAFVSHYQGHISEGTLVPTSHVVPSTLEKYGFAMLSKDRKTGKVFFHPETTPQDSEWLPAFNLSNKRSIWTSLPEDEGVFPSAIWFKRFLLADAQPLTLESDKLRKPSPPHRGDGFKKDGSNLPWVIAKIEGTPALTEWIEHLQTAIPDISGIRSVFRDEDRHRYLKIKYRNGLEVPSWMVSDGTLRMLALTLPAFLKDFGGMLLIEEPENGIHPRAIETVFQALSTVSSAQILLATHSPSILSCAELSQVLCFSKDESGATSIVSGDKHPALQQWKDNVRDVSLGTLFAAGVLG